jgi:hypothetical protein
LSTFLLAPSFDAVRRLGCWDIKYKSSVDRTVSRTGERANYQPAPTRMQPKLSPRKNRLETALSSKMSCLIPLTRGIHPPQYHLCASSALTHCCAHPRPAWAFTPVSTSLLPTFSHTTRYG